MKNYITFLLLGFFWTLSAQTINYDTQFNNNQPLNVFSSASMHVPFLGFPITKCSFEFGKILVSGKNGIKRYNSNGTLDTTFLANNHITSYVRDFVYVRGVGSDYNKRFYIVVGDFTTVNGQAKKLIVALDKNGNLYNSFSFPNISGTSIYKIIDVGGKYLVIGDFNIYYNSRYHHNIIRLNSDGSLDTTFSIDIGNQKVFGAHRDGEKLYLWGNFNTINSVAKQNIVRLHYSNLTVDNTFNPQNNAHTTVVSFLLDGYKILIGFNSGENGVNLKRLNNDGSIDSGFNFNQNVIRNYSINNIYKIEDHYIITGPFYNTIARPSDLSDANNQQKILSISMDGTLNNNLMLDIKSPLAVNSTHFYQTSNNTTYYIVGVSINNIGQICKYNKPLSVIDLNDYHIRNGGRVEDIRTIEQSKKSN